MQLDLALIKPVYAPYEYIDKVTTLYIMSLPWDIYVR